MWTIEATDAEGNKMRFRFDGEMLARLASHAILSATNIDHVQVYFAADAEPGSC